jgi:hypothetical protein
MTGPPLPVELLVPPAPPEAAVLDVVVVVEPPAPPVAALLEVAAAPPGPPLLLVAPAADAGLAEPFDSLSLEHAATHPAIRTVVPPTCTSHRGPDTANIISACSDILPPNAAPHLDSSCSPSRSGSSMTGTLSVGSASSTR